MRRLKTPLALAVTLALTFSSNTLFAQTENPNPVSPLAEPPTQPDKSSATVKPADTNAQPAATKPTTNDTKATLPAGEPASDRQQLLVDPEPIDRDLLTPKINSYHGGKVKIRGYIRPNFKQSGITKFIFVRDNKECCFGPQAAIFDNILVRLERGHSTNYTVRPVTIEGDFVLKEYHGDDGNVWSLYRMYNAKIK